MGRRNLVVPVLTGLAALFIAGFVIDVFSETLIFLGLPVKLPAHGPHFGNWPLVALSVLAFGFFTLAYAVPHGGRDWRSMGLMQGFIVALYFEMYGLPLTIYVLSSYLGFHLTTSHESGHLVAKLLAGVMPFNAAAALVMAVSSTLLALAFALIYAGWRRIYMSDGRLVTGGIYARLRHPQYAGFALITVALLIHWPTIVTLVMWPILLVSYRRLARWEDSQLEQRFGRAYLDYRQKIPAFLPRLRPGSNF